MSAPAWLPERLYEFWAADELSLFRALIVGEAAGEPYIGQLAVAYAAANRKRFAAMSRLPWFHPDSHRDNILARDQFSCFWGTNWKKRAGAMRLALVLPERFPVADHAARACLDGTEPDPTIGLDGVGADHYYAPESCPKPSWAVDQFNADGSFARLGFVRTVRLGRHDFHSSWV